MEKVSELELERFAINDLPDIEMLRLHKLIEESPELQSKVQEIEESNRILLSQLPPKQFNKSVHNQVPRASNNILNHIKTFFSAYSAIKMAGVFASIVLVGFLSLNLFNANHFDHDAPLDRAKGIQPHLNVYKIENGKANLITSKEKLSVNDIVQMSYISAGKKYGYVVSVDSRGVKTVHLSDKEYSIELIGGGEILMPSAYQLDDSPKFERFFLVTADSKFKTSLVDQAINQLIESENTMYGKINLPVDFNDAYAIQSITFLK